MFLSLIQRCWERVLPTEIFRLLSPLGFYSSSAFLPVFRLTLLKAILPYCGCLKPSLCFFNMVFQGLYDLAPDYFSDNQTVLCAYCVLATFFFFFSFPLDHALFKSFYLLVLLLRNLQIFASQFLPSQISAQMSPPRGILW